MSVEATQIDRAALGQALEVAATRFGRLSDEQIRAMRRRRRSVATVVATGSAAVALAFAGVDHFANAPAPVAHWTRTYATNPGQHGTAALADGSTIKLNGATRVMVDYTRDRRTVRLAAGQAYFDVRHDKARPFVVQAGQGEARVLGTAFDVDLTRRRVALSVYRGAVGFDAVGKRDAVVVRAGYRSTLQDGTVAGPTRFDATLPDWRSGWIDTRGMRLDDLVDALGRQSKVAIVPPTGALASITVVGRFRTDRPRALLGAIGDGFGFTVEQRPEGLVLKPRR